MLNDLISKHPTAKPADPEALLDGEIPFVDPAQFNVIDEALIARATMRTRGSCGPSGADAEQWRRMLLSQNYSTDGQDLRIAIANAAKKMCTIELDSEKHQLDAFTACRLIPLDKDGEGGVRPIGVGEVLRRIIGKALVYAIKPDILQSAGSLQLCAGQPSGCEAAVHSMADIFNEEANDGLLLVDATNAFNAINRAALLHNVRYICPPMSIYIRNCYKHETRLFISGGGQIKSSEGTTQGDPLAMAAYGIGITPLFQMIRRGVDIKQVAFADDLAGAQNLVNLKKWWENIEKFGPMLGYFPKASKSWLIVKPNLVDEAKRIFNGTNINVTTEGRKYLGGFIGTDEGKSIYSHKRIEEWIEQLSSLSEIVRIEPHAAYTAFITGFVNKMSYHIRVLPNIDHLLSKLDQIIDTKFIPAITDGHICTTEERLLLSMPIKRGGLSIPIFGKSCKNEYTNSRLACDQFIQNIKAQTTEFVFNDENFMRNKNEIINRRKRRFDEIEESLRRELTNEKVRALDLSQKKGASNWLSAFPSEKEGFYLNKREFSDALCLRYRWQLKRLPTICPCGKNYNVDHAMNCPKGGFIYQRHNRMRNLFAKVMSEVHKDVAIEPLLMPITGESLPASTNTTDEARLDISARGFWQDGQKAFFDVRVFNPFAQVHLNSSLEKCFENNEKEKKRMYNQRIIQIEHGTLSPLIFTPYGGTSRETEHVIKTLCSKIALKRKLPYSQTMNWFRSKISFILMKSAILCVRGTRDWKQDVQIANLDDIELLNFA